MSKVILVLDTPKSCSECYLFSSRYTDMCCRAMNNRTIDYPYPKDYKQEWCPLKALPNKREERYVSEIGLRDSGFIDGWNACIDEILYSKSVDKF